MSDLVFLFETVGRVFIFVRFLQPHQSPWFVECLLAMRSNEIHLVCARPTQIEFHLMSLEHNLNRFLGGQFMAAGERWHLFNLLHLD